MTIRVFVAHPKHLPDDTINDLREMAGAAVTHQVFKAGGNKPVEVVAGRDAFNDHVMACGGWTGWTHFVGEGNTYINGVLRPAFDTIVVTPEIVLGKATADIVTLALKAGKPVFFMPGPDDDMEGRLTPATGVHVRDGENYKTGHVLMVAAEALSL